MIIRKQFKAEVAHRLVSSYSKRCQSIHGHSYVFEIMFSQGDMNDDQMVMDFGQVKNSINTFMDYFDHTMVVCKDDPFKDILVDMMAMGDMRYMVVPYNPTAEMMAEHIYRHVKQFLPNTTAVRVHETKTGYAEYTDCDFINGFKRFNIDDIHFSQAVLRG